jgi:fructosamine-3-kinase
VCERIGIVSTFTKRSPGHGPDFYAVEAAGLRWLAAAGPGSAKVATVVAVHDHQIVLERLEPGRPERAAAEEFGQALAVTHAAGAAAYGQPPDGWDGDGYIGQQPLTLRPTSTWGRFYAAQRMLPYSHRARGLGHLSARATGRVDRVAERLIAGEFDDDRPPARIHGDLWSGNVIFTAGGVVLIDPAAHGGHGLTDLAMLHLFGAPHLATITAAYAEAAQLSDDWADLIGLHQLHPLLVHAVSHGPSYGAEADRIAARYA